MEAIIYLLLGAGLAAVATYVYSKGQLAQQRALLQSKEEELLRTLQQLESKGELLRRIELQVERLEERCAVLSATNSALNASNESKGREIELLNEQMLRENELRNKQFAEQMHLVQERLQTATEELLKQREQELASRNTVQMNGIINPLKESITEMKAAMESSRDTHNKNSASLEKAIEEVMKRTMEIGSEADKLASALRNDNKIQGNWGEMVLSELLESQGLKEGIHYEVQTTLRDSSGKAIKHDESGKRMIPDLILHYPDGKDAIIDSKVSLVAFVDYQHADEEALREEALTRHLRSIRQHVKELARKDYSAYIKAPRQPLNYVIMFVPNESALQLALYNDSSLWRDAFESGVFITSEQNLLAALRMIQLAWTQVQQAQNQEKIFDTARMLLNRVADFIDGFEAIGDKLQKVMGDYDKAKKKLHEGQQSIVGASNNLIKLGAKPDAKKRIPEPKLSMHGGDYLE
ncbi:MAG: DNA recombination protein RmuC [Phocaeicola sp.]